ncbi:hypothetical protein BO79DRAFT_218181 [Aspergillus costaricaensis CBS 115574]|uniref:Uncharacterized protein n=1 Tax=Aspergillus costaricaensis CBS 115574 TaxID=1448317 RepID=A0ACD1ICS6_9EURO|nr:hypothetical protein BO79DRAFT_218181 [Aspergillus costaricaensis CBS 115574]RAK88338.1 hypothetical protein BO79DRAFT_218181 [Aspergillus costaricaensis CBS 115574]
MKFLTILSTALFVAFVAANPANEDMAKRQMEQNQSASTSIHLLQLTSGQLPSFITPFSLQSELRGTAIFLAQGGLTNVPRHRESVLLGPASPFHVAQINSTERLATAGLTSQMNALNQHN